MLVKESCPYCGEPVELEVDPSGGRRQVYEEDCPVCCRPWQVRVRISGRVATVRLGTQDDVEGAE